MRARSAVWHVPYQWPHASPVSHKGIVSSCSTYWYTAVTQATSKEVFNYSFLFTCLLAIVWSLVSLSLFRTDQRVLDASVVGTSFETDISTLLSMFQHCVGVCWTHITLVNINTLSQSCESQIADVYFKVVNINNWSSQVLICMSPLCTTAVYDNSDKINPATVCALSLVLKTLLHITHKLIQYIIRSISTECLFYVRSTRIQLFRFIALVWIKCLLVSTLIHGQ